MGSCKIKSRSYNFFLQGKNGAQPAWDPLIVLWSQKGSPSPARPFVAHTSFPHRIRLASHHRCCCPWWLPWYQHLQTFGSPLHGGYTNSVSWVLFKNSGPATRCRASTTPQGPFSPWVSPVTEAVPLPTASYGLSQCWVPAALHNPVSPAALVYQEQFHVDDSYKWTNLAVSFMCSLGPLWTAASVCWSRETLCSRLCYSDAGLFTQSCGSSHSWPVLIVPAKQRHGFSRFWSFTNHSWFSALADQNHRFLLQNIRWSQYSL